jgi:hypothetical protein
MAGKTCVVVCGSAELLADVRAALEAEHFQKIAYERPRADWKARNLAAAKRILARGIELHHAPTAHRCLELVQELAPRFVFLEAGADIQRATACVRWIVRGRPGVRATIALASVPTREEWQRLLDVGCYGDCPAGMERPALLERIASMVRVGCMSRWRAPVPVAPVESTRPRRKRA